MANVSYIVTELIQAFIEEKGYELVDVEYIKEGKDWYLRIYIDKDEGINIEDCEIVSRHVSEIFDKTDPIKNSYILEVSSPGIERPLKKDSDFTRFSGSKVYIKTYELINGKKEFEGILSGLENSDIVIEVDKEKYSIPKEKVASAHLKADLF